MKLKDIMSYNELQTLCFTVHCMQQMDGTNGTPNLKDVCQQGVIDQVTKAKKRWEETEDSIYKAKIMSRTNIGEIIIGKADGQG